MSKYIKYFVLISVLLLLCGCGEEEYQDYLDSIGDGATCVYYPYGDNQFSTKLTSITFDAQKDGLEVTYKLTSGSSVTEKYIDIELDDNGEFKSIDENNTHNVGDYKFSFSNFTLVNFFNNFRNNGNNCQQYIYLYDNRSSYLFYETKYTELNDDFMYTFSTKAPAGNDDKEEETGGASACENAQATDCQKYNLDTYLNGEVTVELGRANDMDYFMVYTDSSSGINYNYNGTDSSGIRIGSYTFIVREVDWNNLFPSSTTYASELVLDEKVIAGSVVAHITVPGSETITDYEGFGSPEEVDMDPDYDTGDPNVEVPDLPIEEINFCDQNGVQKTFQIIGYLLFVAKIIVPLLLIILGTIDFAKATVSSDDKAPRDAVVALIRRIIIAVIIFFIPTILNFLLSLVNGASEAFNDNGFTGCTDCLFDPFGDCEASDIGE